MRNIRQWIRDWLDADQDDADQDCCVDCGYDPEENKWDGPQTMTCRDCGHVVEARITDAPYLRVDDPRLCGHLTETYVRMLEGLRLTDIPSMRMR